jgi:hypothetical protein
MDAPEGRAATSALTADEPRHFGVLLLIFLVGFGTLVIRSCVQELRQAQWRDILRTKGQVAFGEVTQSFVGRGGDAFVTYKFDVNGTAYSGNAQLPRHYSRAGLHESDGIFIRFLPSDPSVNHPKAWEWSVFMDIDSMIGGGFFVVLGVSGLVILHRRRRRRNLGQVPAELS